jgi:hypothetical protein
MKQNLVFLENFSITYNFCNVSLYLILLLKANYAAEVIASASSSIINFTCFYFVKLNDWDSANLFIVSLTVYMPLSFDALSLYYYYIIIL